MLHDKMKKVLDIFKKYIDSDESSYWYNDKNDDKFQIFDYMDFVSITFDPVSKNKKDNPVCFSFYSGCPPTFAAYLVRTLYKHGITDFEVLENQYPSFDENGVFKDMLFGDEADEKYEENIYKRVRNKKYQNFETKKVDQKSEENKIG
jgi:hypothetical protein